MDGATVLIAREITTGGHTIALRDAGGKPLWSGAANGAGGGHKEH